MLGEPIELTGYRGDLKRVFQEFWFQLVGISGSCARSVDQEAITVGQVDEHHLNVYTPKNSHALRFRGLPYRPDDSSRVVDAWLQFNEIVRGRELNGPNRPTYEIVESATRIQYIVEDRAEDGERIGRARQGVRFEFKEHPDANHPVFHAHFDPVCVESGATQDYYRVEEPEFIIPSYPRIPSAPIDLVGATYMLLHDHVPEILEDDHGWPSDTHTAIQKLPNFPASCFSHDPQGGNGMFCDWWYLHATLNDDGFPQRRVLLR